MKNLQLNMSGPEVLVLQKQLQQLGFLPGACDGIFGPETRTAVMAFQRSASLTPDGSVGPQTSAALTAAHSPAPPYDGPMPLITTDMVAKMFPGTPLANIQANLPSVLYALQAAGQTSTPLVLAALATIAAETASFEPIREATSKDNTSPDGRPFDRYDHRENLGNLLLGDGARFCGRGYVQLTGRRNYTYYGPLAGQPDLVETPDLANAPDTAASLLAAFIKAHSAAISAALQRNDMETARRQVNGGSHGLKAFTHAYQTGMALLAAGSAGPAQE